MPGSENTVSVTTASEISAATANPSAAWCSATARMTGLMPKISWMTTIPGETLPGGAVK